METPLQNQQVQLRKFLAKTQVREGKNEFHRLPIRLWVYKDGVFVRDGDRQYKELIGKRVIRVGKLPVDEALERVATVTPRDNTQQIKWMAPHYMTRVEVLDALGIIDGLDHVDLVLEDEAGRQTTERVQAKPYSEVFAVMSGDKTGLMTMSDAASAEVPLWQKDSRNNYWFEYLQDENIVYFQYNSVQNKTDDESIADFSKRLFAFIDNKPVEALVIDVRRNNGGNNFLNRPILHGVIRNDKINQHGRLFIITGRETFSACQNFCNRMERHTKAMFVGEPTGSRPNFVGEGNSIQLPYSGLVVNGSSRYWQDSVSDDYREWIAPHLVAEMTSVDVKTNRDPAMETILAYLANRKKAGGGRASR